MLSEIKTLSPRSRRLLRVMPFCMSITRRMKVFEHLVNVDKARYQNRRAPGVPLRVRRYCCLVSVGGRVGGGGGVASKVDVVLIPLRCW